MRQNPHVRICGGPGSATTLVYPTAHARACCTDWPYVWVGSWSVARGASSEEGEPQVDAAHSHRQVREDYSAASDPNTLGSK